MNPCEIRELGEASEFCTLVALSILDELKPNQIYQFQDGTQFLVTNNYGDHNRFSMLYWDKNDNAWATVPFSEWKSLKKCAKRIYITMEEFFLNKECNDYGS